MATEPAEGGELSVSLPQPLEEWVSERADSLGMDREELLVQVVSAYRATADLDDDAAAHAESGELQERIEQELEVQLDRRDREIEAIDARVDELEEGLEDDLEALRNRVLQLRDAVRNRAMEDHSHEEFARLADRMDELSAEAAELSKSITGVEDELATVETKLDTLARVVIRLRDADGNAPAGADDQLDRLRRIANQKGVTEAACADCGESVSVPLLTESACPHCSAELRDITTTGILFSRAKLVGPDPDEATDE